MYNYFVVYHARSVDPPERGGYGNCNIQVDRQADTMEIMRGMEKECARLAEESCGYPVHAVLLNVIPLKNTP